MNICKIDKQAAENVDGREIEKEGRVQSSSFISTFFIRTFLTVIALLKSLILSGILIKSHRC